MGGLSTALLIGVGGLDAAQGALDATSNNIANVNTPGYTREEAQLSELAENDSNNQITGGGVTLDGLQSIRDELLNMQIQSADFAAKRGGHGIFKPPAGSNLLHSPPAPILPAR
jgi:flagellar hook-associated protein FlgK